MSRTYEQLEPVISALDERIKTGLSAFPTDTAEGSIASFPDGADGIPLKSLVVDINPVQDLSQGDPSPENICPISGWTQVGVEQRGVNLFDGTFVNMAIASTAIATIGEDPIYRGFYARIKGGQTYTVSRAVIETNRFRIGASVEEPADGVVATELAVLARYDTEYTITVTVPDGYNYLFAYLSNQSDTCTANNYQVQLGSTATPYSPYTGRSITINLGQTVYGGKLDVLTGKLTVYPYYASYNGETLTGRWISDRDMYAVGTTPTIGAQVVNIGAEGTEIQLSPNEVKSLLGQNNIFADTGDAEVEYRADTKMYIERLTEPDADMITDANIVSGSYFMVGNILYKATANIASGSTVIEGTNATRKSLATALNEINQ